MPNQKSIPPPEPNASDTNSDVPEAALRKELGELVDNDPEAPYVVPQRTSFFFGYRQWVKAGGHFPSGVAFFAIATLGSTVVLCSGISKTRAQWVNLSAISLFLGSALIAQGIHASHKQG